MQDSGSDADQILMAIGPHTATVLVTSGIWLVVLALLRLGAARRERRRLGSLRHQLADASQANLAATHSFRDRLSDQDAILDRIVSVSGRILNGGITDPKLTLDDVRLIEGHARDARALIENTVIELRLASGLNDLAPETVDLRGEIETVSRTFVPARIATNGPNLVARTNAPMFRVLLRSLIAAAVERGSDEIDVVVAHDKSTVLCTISDDADCETAPSPPQLAATLATALDTEITVSRRMRRNLYTVSFPAAARRVSAATPLDVLGERKAAAADPASMSDPSIDRSHRIVFPEPVARDEIETVAARRRRHPITR